MCKDERFVFEFVFSEQDYPAGLTSKKPDSRKASIEKRRASGVTNMHVDVGVGRAIAEQASRHGESNGGSRSAKTNEHGESERRMRQSKSKVIDVGIGSDSSEDIGTGRTTGQVRF